MLVARRQPRRGTASAMGASFGADMGNNGYCDDRCDSCGCPLDGGDIERWTCYECQFQKQTEDDRKQKLEDEEEWQQRMRENYNRPDTCGELRKESHSLFLKLFL